MSHLTDEQLVLHYYGEPPEEPIGERVDACAFDPETGMNSRIVDFRRALMAAIELAIDSTLELAHASLPEILPFPRSENG